MRIPGMEHFCFGGSPSIVRMDVVTPCQHSEMEIRFHERLRSRKDVYSQPKFRETFCRLNYSRILPRRFGDVKNWVVIVKTAIAPGCWPSASNAGVTIRNAVCFYLVAR
ncbi:MAG: hypothetical protein OXG62_07580 [Nitrospinae bacterium]|nr:hypothetical protein [Nitrospinota bacterium]